MENRYKNFSFCRAVDNDETPYRRFVIDFVARAVVTIAEDKSWLYRPFIIELKTVTNISVSRAVDAEENPFRQFVIAFMAGAVVIFAEDKSLVYRPINIEWKTVTKI
jgi:hypothetical protein